MPPLVLHFLLREKEGKMREVEGSGGGGAVNDLCLTLHRQFYCFSPAEQDQNVMRNEKFCELSQ